MMFVFGSSSSSTRARRNEADREDPSSPSHAPVLFITDREFWRRSIGSEVRIASLVQHLARRGEDVQVAYVGRVTQSEWSNVESFAAAVPGVEIIARRSGRPTALDARLAITHLKDAVSRFSRGPHRRSRIADASFPSPPALERTKAARRAFVQSALRSVQPRVVIVEFLRLTYTVHPRHDGLPTPPRYWIDTHDALHRRAERFRAAGLPTPEDLTAAREAERLATYDAILAIQDAEAKLFRDLVPNREVLVVPHGTDRSDGASRGRAGTVPETPPRSTGPDRAGPIRMGFLGGRDESNRHGLDWFFERVWPEIHARFGHRIECAIAGEVGRGWDRSIDGVDRVGPIESAEAFWRTIDVAINPVQVGSGLKIKNVEALVHGCALLTTPVGAEGLADAAPDGMRVAADPAEWIGALAEWIESPEAVARAQRRARAYADAQLSEEGAYRALRTRLAEVVEGRPE